MRKIYHRGRMSKLILFLAKVLVVFAFVSTETESDFVSVRRTPGQRVITVRLAGLTAMETAAGEPTRTHGLGRDNSGSGRAEPGAEPSFIFREVTNGNELVQAIFDGNYTPRNCFISSSSADQEKILDLLNIAEQQQKAMMPNLTHQDLSKSKILQESSSQPNNNIVTSMATLEPSWQFSRNASDYTFLQVQKANQNLTPFLRSIIDLDGIKAKCRHLKFTTTRTPTGKLTTRRRRRGLLTYPQTLWCGQGTEASHYDQLGEAETTDKCCRDHDLCSHLQIKPMEKKMFLRNIAPYTMSDCRCDKMFHKCLKRARSPVADGVGDVFFNRLKIKCFVTRKKIQCLETNWIGSCLRKENTDTAVVRDARPFPEGKNLTKAEKAIRRKKRVVETLI